MPVLLSKKSRRFQSSAATSTLDKTMQLQNSQVRHPKPPRPPPSIYEYIPSTRPATCSSKAAKEQDIDAEMKASKSEEQHLDIDVPEVSKTEKRDLDVKLYMNEEHNKNDLEMKDNIAYHPTQ